MKQNTGTIKGETKSGQDIKTWATQTGQVITLEEQPKMKNSNKDKL